MGKQCYIEGMSSLVLPYELARTFIGGLLTVCRADGDVLNEEFRVLRRFSALLLGRLELDVDILLFVHVTPRSFAEAIAQHRAGNPFRQVAASSPEKITSAFIDAAFEVATIDGTVNEDEARSIRAFARACGYDSPAVTALARVLEEPKHP